MKNFLAHFISIILIPLLVPTYLFIIIFIFFPHLSSITTLNKELLSIVSILVSTTLFTFIFVFILFKLGKISSLSLNDKKDRPLPQLFACINYAAVSLILIYLFGIHDALTLSVIAATISLIAISIITPFWKISAHTSGISGIFSVVTILYFKNPSEITLLLSVVVFCLSIAICFARYYLKVHTILQIFFGYLLGFGSGFFIFYFTNIAVY